MKIGIYGGTFDPLHNGHLILARDAVESLGLDKLIFVPNRISPFKEGTKPAPAEVRLQMIHVAIAHEPCLAVDDLELHRPPPSYAIDTVRAIESRFPGAELYYLIGEDNLGDLDGWRESEVLRAAVRFVVFKRPGSFVENNPRRPETPLLLPRQIEISSTEIRSRVAKGLSIRYLVPDSVLELIEHHQLYKESSHYSPTIS